MEPLPINPDDLISTEEARQILGLKSRQGVIWLIKNKGLKAVEVKGRERDRWVLRRGDVEEYRRQRGE